MSHIDEVFGLRRLTGTWVGSHGYRFCSPGTCRCPAVGLIAAILSVMLGHDRRELAAIFVGGALGTLARAGLETLAAPDHRRLRLDGG